LLGINAASWLHATTAANLDRQRRASQEDAGVVAEIGRLVEALTA
jgi:hypothetical protein